MNQLTAKKNIDRKNKNASMSEGSTVMLLNVLQSAFKTVLMISDEGNLLPSSTWDSQLSFLKEAVVSKKSKNDLDDIFASRFVKFAHTFLHGTVTKPLEIEYNDEIADVQYLVIVVPQISGLALLIKPLSINAKEVNNVEEKVLSTIRYVEHEFISEKDLTSQQALLDYIAMMLLDHTNAHLGLVVELFHQNERKEIQSKVVKKNRRTFETNLDDNDFKSLSHLFSDNLQSETVQIANDVDIEFLDHLNVGKELTNVSSVLAIPLLSQKNTMGVILLCGEKPFHELLQSYLKPVITAGSVMLSAIKNQRQREKAEQALISSRQKYFNIFHSFTDVYFECNLDALVKTISPSVSSMFGVPTSEIVGARLSNYFVKRADWKKLIISLQDNNHAKRFKTRVKISNEKNIPISVNARLVFDVNQHPVGIRGVFQDISSLEKTQGLIEDQKRLIDEGEARYQTIFEGAPDAINLVDPENYSILEYNKQAAIMLGYTNEEYASFNMFQFHKKEHQVDFKKATTRLFDTGKVQYESVLVGKNDIKKDVLISSSLVQISGKEYIQNIIKDISERKSAIQALEVSKARYKMLFNQAPVGIMSISISGIIVSTNQHLKNMFGYEEPELIGEWVNVLYPENLTKGKASKVLNNFFDITHLKEKLELAEVFALKKKNGDFITCEVKLSYIEEEGVSYGIALIRDVSERIRAEEAFKSLEQKETLLKEIHHRVKNNMQIITSLLSLQERQITNPEAREKYLESKSRIQSMALVHEKLYQSEDLSKIDFKDYIVNLIRYLMDMYDRSGVKTVLDVDSAQLDIDKAIPCGLIVNELITNSLKYAFKDVLAPELSVKFKQKEHQFILEIGDNGCGLPDTFDINKAKSLGLKLVKSLSSQVGGTIVIGNKPEGGVLGVLKFESDGR